MSALRNLSNDLVSILKPPRRVRVSEAAAAHLAVSESKTWDATIAPYMIRPMNGPLAALITWFVSWGQPEPENAGANTRSLGLYRDVPSARFRGGSL